MTAVKVAKKRPGRPALVEDGKWKPINCKTPPELHAEYMALGGSKWLRETLAASLNKRLRKPPAG